MSVKLGDIEVKHQRLGDMERFESRLNLSTLRDIPSRTWMRIPIDQMDDARATIAVESRMAILQSIYGDLVEPINLLYKMVIDSARPDFDEIELKRIQAEVRAVFNGTTYEEEREH